MFAKMDKNHGAGSGKKKQDYTNSIRKWEEWLSPRQVGIFSNKMQATLDQASKNKKTSSKSSTQSKSSQKLNTPVIRRSKGAVLIKRPKAVRARRSILKRSTDEDKLG